jgi:hypothetical protein
MNCIEINPIEELLKAIGILRGEATENMYRGLIHTMTQKDYNDAPDYFIRECAA